MDSTNRLQEKPFNAATMISDNVAYQYDGCPCTVTLENGDEWEGVLTTEHAASSYGIPVLVLNDAEAHVVGVGELHTFRIKTIVANAYNRPQANLALNAAYGDAGYPISAIELHA